MKMKLILVIALLAISFLQGNAQYFAFEGVCFQQPRDNFRIALESKETVFGMPDNEKKGSVTLDRRPELLAYDGDDVSVKTMDLAYSFETPVKAMAFKQKLVELLKLKYPRFTVEEDTDKSTIISGKSGTIKVYYGDDSVENIVNHNVYNPRFQYVIFVFFTPTVVDSHLYITIKDDGAVIKGSPDLKNGQLVLPSVVTINDEEVNILGVRDYAFYQRKDLESLVIGDGIQYLGANSFSNCSNLVDIQLGEGLKTLGKYAFGSIPNIRSITLPSTLEKIEPEVFYNCQNLKSILVREGSRFLKSDGQVLYSADGKTLIWMLEGFDGEYVVPHGVKHIADYGMSADSLRAVTLPDGLISIGKYAFANDCKLTSVKIPASVVSIGSCAFIGCWNIEKIDVPKRVTELPEEVFFYCRSLRSITLPKKLASIGNNAFYGCGELTNLELPAKLKSIGEEAFYNCHFTGNIQLPARLEKLGKNAFSNYYSIDNFFISSDNPYFKSIDGIITNKRGDTLVLFPSGRKGNYVLPEGIAVIADNAFSGSKINNLTLPKSLRVISNKAFDFSIYLRSIVIPEGVTEIGDEAFAYCYRLKVVHLPSTIKKVGRDLGEEDINFYAPDDVYDRYISMKRFPKLKRESEYKPIQQISAADIIQKIIGFVEIERPMWSYKLDELTSMIPDTIPVKDNSDSWFGTYALSTDLLLDLPIGDKTYSILSVRIYVSEDDFVNAQESAIDGLEDTKIVARHLIEEAQKLGFIEEKRSTERENSVLMHDKTEQIKLGIVTDIINERVHIAIFESNNTLYEETIKKLFK